MKNVIASLICLTTTGVAHAAGSAVTIECPIKFPAESVKFSGIPSGWTPTAPHSLELGNAEVMHGPPASLIYAAPTTYKEGKRSDVGTWGMSSSPLGQNWLQCAYGARGELRLSQQLPAATSSCIITKHKDAEGNLTRAIAVCTLVP